MKMIRQKRDSNNRRQMRIESKRPVTVIQAVTAMLMTMTTTSKTTTRMKVYNLSNASCLSSVILL
jgi:hypothetical protein